MSSRGQKTNVISSLMYPSIVCFLILGINSHLGGSAFQARCFYYYYSEKVYLDLSSEMIMVSFKEAIAEEAREALITNDPVLEGVSKDRLPSGLMLALTKEGTRTEDVLQAVERLSGLAEVKYCTPVFEYQDLKLVLTDQFVARFKPETTKEEIATLNKTCGVEIVRISPYRHNRYVLRVMNPKDITALEMANTYNEHPSVKYASPDFTVLNAFCSTEPNDIYFGEQWGLDNDGNTAAGGTADADMNAPEGWDIHTGSSATIIAIIDTGVDIDHDDLAANIWTNPNEQTGDGNADGRPGIKDVDDDNDGLVDEDSEGHEPGDPGYDNDLVNDDDENGYIDDMCGWDFVDEDNNPRPNTVGYGSAHGTACAGLAAAVTDNADGIAGVSWRSKIMALRTSGTATWAEAIDYAAANGADVLSNSYDSNPDTDLTDAIVEAKNTGRDGKGCVIVCASGNIPRPPVVHYPASLDETIAVGATDANDEKWDYSIGGAKLDVVAPSGDGESTIFWTTDISGSYGYDSGDYTQWFGGTSAATPQVAGLAALILSVKSSLRSDEVQFIIESTADDRGETGWDPNYGWGRVNIQQALSRASDYSLFRVENTDGVPVADFDNYGNLFLKGILTQNTTPTATGNDKFRVQDSDGNDVAIVDMTNGNMHLAGSVQATWANPSEGSDDFIIKDSSGATVAYIDDSGNLYLKGSAYGPEP